MLLFFSPLNKKNFSVTQVASFKKGLLSLTLMLRRLFTMKREHRLQWRIIFTERIHSIANSLKKILVVDKETINWYDKSRKTIQHCVMTTESAPGNKYRER